NAILLVELFASFDLCGDVLGMQAPRTLSLLGLEFDDADSLPVISTKALVRDKARHLRGELTHSRDPLEIFVLQLGPHPGTKYRDHHVDPPPGCSFIARRSRQLSRSCSCSAVSSLSNSVSSRSLAPSTRNTSSARSPSVLILALATFMSALARV